MRRLLALSLIAVCAAPFARSAAAAPPPDARAAATAQRMILEPAPGTIVTVEGRYRLPSDLCPARRERVPPLLAKYRGRLELIRTGDGTIRLINELSFSDYLRGLAEVPLSWPMEALRAQVIAARSYALDAYAKGRGGAYDICSTDACQVYRGATIELGPFGERWVRAVEGTRARVLRYGGRTIQAFYFSTSDGRTRSSFPGGTPQPWLPSVDGEDDDAPLAHWTARFPLADLAVILRAAGEWSGGRIARVTRDGETLTFRGPGASRSMSTSDFRIEMNNQAICEFPDRYPSKTGTQSGGSLPQTIPSTSFAIEQRGDVVVLRGRGWGHFVGMSQWGARSLAARGRSDNEILRHYYGPARIQRIREPSSIRVLASENLRLVRLSIDGPARVTTSTGSRLDASKPFEIRAGPRLRILRGRGPRLRGVLEVRARRRAIEGEAGGEARVPFVASDDARVAVLVLDASGAEIARTPERSFLEGRGIVVVPLVGTAGTPLEPGTYGAVLAAYDGLDRARSEPVTLTVTEAALVTTPAPRTSESRPTWPLYVAGVALLVALIGLALRGFLSRR